MTAPARSKRILVVEDDAAIRESLVDALEMEGYEVTAAQNGLDALERLEKMPHPCLILLDVFMPVLDGNGFLDAVKKDHRDTIGTLPIFVVSAGAPGSEALKTAKHRATEFVKKPIDLDLMLELVEKHCG